MGIISDIPGILGTSRDIIYKGDILAERIPNHALGCLDELL